MIEVIRYDENKRADWNKFVSTQSNNLFTFHRDYLDYHRERFNDFSLMIYKNKKICAVFPAHISDQEFVSHDGLTFGGLNYSPLLRTFELKEIVDKILGYLKKEAIYNFRTIPIPLHYRSSISYNDVYFIFRNGGKLIKQKISYVLDLKLPLKLNKNKKRTLKSKTELSIGFSYDYPDFIKILNTLLKEKYDTNPVHSNSEMEYLFPKFKDNIKLVSAHFEGQMVGGIILYIYGNTVKIQYTASNPLGNKHNAIAFLVQFIHQEYSASKNYLDMGTAYESDNKLNKDLVHFKESFGAVGMSSYTYSLNIQSL